MSNFYKTTFTVTILSPNSFTLDVNHTEQTLAYIDENRPHILYATPYSETQILSSREARKELVRAQKDPSLLNLPKGDFYEIEAYNPEQQIIYAGFNYQEALFAYDLAINTKMFTTLLFIKNYTETVKRWDNQHQATLFIYRTDESSAGYFHHIPYPKAISLFFREIQNKNCNGAYLFHYAPEHPEGRITHAFSKELSYLVFHKNLFHARIQEDTEEKTKLEAIKYTNDGNPDWQTMPIKGLQFPQNI